ncbi:hypothetical protein [Sphingobium lignivorans]|uniref:Uncharacterized protein (DUF58 family) n=1 Tax=Sphingobium lignivorans TaxID=2735886 RepID=A0ABR6NIH9_9SPHN|nr:hypothetical protein [Sphingobium lignivorans]MBB5985989.1 uncharacterized protein (DUF58 family) [Sphingobium lignivorans]
MDDMKNSALIGKNAKVQIVPDSPGSHMSRLERKMAEREDKPVRPQPTRIGETGYQTLHPTRGWKKVSYKRAKAQQLMGMMLDRATKGVRKTLSPRSDSAHINRHTGKPHEGAREKAKRRGRFCSRSVEA